LFQYLANGYLEEGRVQLTADNEIVIDKVTNNVNKAIKNE